MVILCRGSNKADKVGGVDHLTQAGKSLGDRGQRFVGTAGTLDLHSVLAAQDGALAANFT